MRRALRSAAIVVLAFGVLVSFFACAKKEPKKLTIWVPGRDSYIGPDEQKKAQEDWYISKAFKRFEKANPGVSLELVVEPDAAEAHQTFKAAAVAGNAPDIANLWSGQYVFGIKDAIRPIDDLVPKADLTNLVGWETMRDGFKADGALYGYAGYTATLCFLFYNKDLVKKAGLDFEANPPRTTQEFDVALEKIKKTGVIPIVTDESFPWFNLYIAVYWWYQTSGPERILKDCLGQEKFSEDKGLLDMLEYYHSLYQKGYVNRDASTSTDYWAKFLQGKAAITPQVSLVMTDAITALGADKVGILSPPDIDPKAPFGTGKIVGGTGGALVVSKNSKNPDLAVKFLSFISSKAEVLTLLKSQAFVPIRKDITPAEMGYTAGSIQEKMYSFKDKYVYFVDNILTPGVVDEYYKMCPLVLVGKMTPKQFAADLDAKAAEMKK
jgi:ABC-type glycerol-3-phosphate transport system substrate-binding protein